ncbi:MAG: hypothetical protein ACLGIA_13440 [Actinomycetes bacterium]
MARPLRLAAVAALVLLVGCSCGSGPSPTGGVAPGAAGTTQGSGASTTAGPAGGGQGARQTGGAGAGQGAGGQGAGGQAAGGGHAGAAGGQRGSGAGGFAYTPWGPDDPPIPTQYAVLAAAPGRPPRCSDLADNRPGGPFWSTALQVCQAITGAGPWPQASSGPPPPAAENAYQACLDTELRAMLDRALRWHALHPGARPAVQYPASSSRSPCQYRIYGFDVLDPRSSSSGETPAGKVPLAILVGGVEGIPDDVAVTVDGVPAELTSDYSVPEPGDGMTALFVLAEQTAQPRRAAVEVTLRGTTSTASVEIPAASGPAGTATASTPPATATTSAASSSASSRQRAVTTSSEPPPATSTAGEPPP